MTAHRRPPARAPLTTAGTALAALLLAACGGEGSDTGRGSEGAELSHVHGLGVGPADSGVYVATHDGLYTVAEGRQPKLVGDRKDDFMGFTVADESTLIASGHGAEGSGRPGNLGLIQSTDAGRTWTARSLEGDADFHSLESVRGTVYGYEGGRIRVSRDLKSWDDRASLEALDLAVNPDGDTLLATTADGVVASTDGGRTFGEATEPVQAFASWPADESLFGIDLSGKLSRSSDSGKTWQQLATVPGGRPQALTAVNAERILAATQDGVYESRDGGKTFTELAPLAS
ncbi:F510_1955 family glycosylhydrolase [Streptomyces sporangiiformans]|uniref:Exo-alpha-sialidase n=1 Tax=Streptomyces sporangiiformans TaxID=2315329 RepID=A0A505DQA7_9ACTN|nr:sialidase family protein [Streptomyces sporangiiformans]TPQ23464.1 exo-alpha-sialidase [Streptomyces sporangiiformans]